MLHKISVTDYEHKNNVSSFQMCKVLTHLSGRIEILTRKKQHLNATSLKKVKSVPLFIQY